MRVEQERNHAFAVRGLLVAAVSSALILVGALPAAAIYTPEPVTPQAGFITEVTITGSQYASNVTGELTTLGPTPAPYPATGASVEAVSPQLITISDPTTGATGTAYCIDFSTETGVGAGYAIGEWDESNVPHLTYINYILTNYFPFDTTNPISALTPAQQVAAVQTAIWYFSDGFVLATGTDPVVRNATALVVQDALDSGGLPEPTLPTLAIDPATAEVPVSGEVVGPFTVTGNVTGTLDIALGVEVFFDAAATQPVTDADPIPPGTQLWARWTGPDLPINGFRITGVASLTQGTVYLYDPESSDLDEAQKLVLAQTATLPVRAGVRVTPYAAGALSVTKTITGSGAGLQGDITIQIDCTPGLPPGIPNTAVLPAGVTVPDPIVFTGIPDGASCTVSEPANGANAAVTLTTQTIEPATVTIDAEAPAPVAVTVTNAYEPVPVEPVEPVVPAEGSGLAASGLDPAVGALGFAGFALLATGLLIRLRRASAGRIPR
ncbi:hypothetical protein CQ042_11770 [Microbacterium sp. MYb62]|nr:hypothetical protein CQ042_11770 [Microbacterium sp. MYb62]